MYPKIPEQGTRRVPLHRDLAVFRLITWSVGAACAFALAIILITPAPLGPRVIFGGGAFAVGAFIVACVMMLTSIVPGVVRVGTSIPLRFLPARRMVAALPLIYVPTTAYAAALVALRLLQVPGSPSSGVFANTPFVLLGLGVIAIGREIWVLRVPLGLGLDEQGLSGVRQSRDRIDLRWEEIASVEVVPVKKRSEIILTTTTGSARSVQTGWIGSDPNLVAPIITHYLHHPEDRHLLADPRAAIHRVEEATAAAR